MLTMPAAVHGTQAGVYFLPSEDDDGDMSMEGEWGGEGEGNGDGDDNGNGDENDSHSNASAGRCGCSEGCLEISACSPFSEDE